jgi:hypothetical protein
MGFPEEKHTYKMPPEELKELEKMLDKQKT